MINTVVQPMKVVYHEQFTDSRYAADPAAEAGRIECIYKELKDIPEIEFVKSKPAGIADLKLVHTEAHINAIKGRDLLFKMASLAAGGAIEAAKIALKGEPAFALIRPPGHHASAGSSWGFCYFNNLAIALQSLRRKGEIESAYVLDFDLHFGDGTVNLLGKIPEIEILNPESDNRRDYLEEISRNFEKEGSYDVVGVSAGFDEHVEDWGGKLTTSDYGEIGSLIKKFSEKKCKGRRFAVLEGGYNQKVLGKNVKSFLKGFG